MNTPVLHYLYDPLCGWCYGAAPLVKTARDLVTVRLHGGGMMAGRQRQAVTPALRQYVRHHDEHIARLSAQVFGPAYVDGLLTETGAVLDSEPPTTAILAAEAMVGRGLDMLAQLQIAHYVEGRRIAEVGTLVAVAETLGLDPVAFAKVFAAQSGRTVQSHIEATRALMARTGVQGFPGFVLETESGLQRLESADVAHFLGRPREFGDWLRLKTAAFEPSRPPANFGCDANGCVL